MTMGLRSLLFVLTLNLQKKGESLPGLIEEIRSMMDDSPTSKSLSNQAMPTRATDSDSKKYPLKYKIGRRSCSGDGRLPRITGVGDGIGDLKYSVQLSSMRDFEIDYEEI